MEYSNLLLIVAIVAIFYYLAYASKTVQNFENAPKSVSKDIEELDNLDEVFNDIADGNPISYANREAPTNDKTKKHQDPYVYFGTPIDLNNKHTALPEQPMTYFANNVSCLECCPSNYSTDKGCVCWSPTHTTDYPRRNSAISPSS